MAPVLAIAISLTNIEVFQIPSFWVCSLFVSSTENLGKKIDYCLCLNLNFNSKVEIFIIVGDHLMDA